MSHFMDFSDCIAELGVMDYHVVLIYKLGVFVAWIYFYMRQWGRQKYTRVYLYGKFTSFLENNLRLL